MIGLRNIWYPERYHGHTKTKDFFEGWYYKLVDHDESHMYAFIPGIFLGSDQKSSHSFIQVLHGNTGTSHYIQYPLEDFWAAKDSFHVTIGKSSFKDQDIYLDIQDRELCVQGHLTFTQQVPWPKSFFSPGIMGWYSFLPFMECYHGVISLDHKIQGTLNIQDSPVNFTHGRGYIEKDWGKAFPQGWLWTQSNHFQTVGTSFMASIASVPWMGSKFVGFLMALWHENSLYTFTTYNGSRLEHLSIQENTASFRVYNKKTGYELSMQGEGPTGGSLKAPCREDMLETVRESLKAQLNIQCYHRPKNGDRQLLFSGTGNNGGLELCGNVNALQCS